MKEFLDDKTFSIIIKNNYINIINFKKIEKLEDNVITLLLENNKIIINGNNLKTIKLVNDEILIKGLISNVEFR